MKTKIELKNRITDEVYFITVTVIDWIDIFTRPAYKHIIIDSLQYCRKEKGLVIYAWVLMTNHLHMIIGSSGECPVSDIIRDFKKFTSKEIIHKIETDIQESRSDWLLNRFEYAGQNDNKIKKYKFWQKGNDMQAIFTNDYFKQKLNYIHENPVKAEIVNKAEDYRYSSAIDYSGEKGLLNVTVI